ncbi:hypothetical protein AGABI1DRAFT_116689 [Agaricus bisporus var. burnettii JB137-S8]|nr:hypothetical protein AGABI2DRAFT_195559 [Agaricus bisporus var. bisporus H97]XP_007334487.1 uncharacterized protein AGABI1DRAFT_116689 [Agaricus bisporus var. burnettii JB137-S8]EKM74884.1 hypothetical protein AGABI1DRAFT_116689 [Agaricus bisporus var. burnettii JB137-S8]EKV42754.1 hypothetical protein AGABI2DRAFT_195559 [Agaricus bisporus var. bisporus H97]
MFFNTYLFGIVSFQFIRYYVIGFKDPWWIRSSVAFLLVVDIFHSCAIVYMAWGYFVANFTNTAIVGVALWPYTFTPIGTALAAVVTHMFLSYRIYRLNGLRWMFGVFIVLAAASLATGVASGTKAWLIKDLSKLSQLNILVEFWLIIQMVVDTGIAGVMAYVLWKSKTGFRNTDNVIHKLIRGAVQTGIFATIFAAGDLISFVTNPETNIYGMFAIPLGRIYTNTLMHTLNLREDLKEQLTDTIELNSSRNNRSTGIQIKVQGHVTTRFDAVNSEPESIKRDWA